ncbi:hypothetical protein [Corallococcus sp. M7]
MTGLSDVAVPVSKPQPGRDSPLSDPGGDILEILLGYIPVLMALFQFAPLLAGRRMGLREVLLTAVLVPVGSYFIAWGRLRRQRRARRRAEVEASIPATDRIHDRVLPAISRALSGDILPAVPLGFVDLLRQPGQGNAPERWERLRFLHDGVPLLAYETSWSSSKEIPMEERSRGLHGLHYWRVRAQVPETVIFALYARRFEFSPRLHPVERPGPRSFDELFVLDDRSGWLGAHLTEPLRAVLLRRPGFYLRCHRGRLECLWPRDAGPDTYSRFDDAAHLVATLARALHARSLEPRTS